MQNYPWYIKTFLITMLQYAGIQNLNTGNKASLVTQTGNQDRTTPQDPPRQKKSFSEVSQCCRIKVSIVSNEGRSVVLNNIIMIVGHHLGKETPELL